MRIDIRHLIESPPQSPPQPPPPPPTPTESPAHPKNILVVCSHQKGSDFNNPLNDNLKALFGDNAEYTFCDNILKDKKCNFPENIDSNNKCDVIWFAGCNMSHWIFRSPKASIVKINQVLYPDGFIVFTETRRYVDGFGGVNNLTLPIEFLGVKSKFFEPDRSELVDTINVAFNKYFEQFIVNNHLLYKFKIRIGENPRHKKSKGKRKGKSKSKGKRKDKGKSKRYKTKRIKGRK